MRLTSLAWLGLLSLALGGVPGYGYGFSGTAPFIPSGTAPCTGTATGGPYGAYNTSVSAYPTDGPTHGPYPFWKRAAFYPAGAAASTDPWGTTGTVASTGDPTAGTAASTGIASSFGSSGKLTYTAPAGIPAEYFYHHKRPKRNAARGGRYGYQG